MTAAAYAYSYSRHAGPLPRTYCREELPAGPKGCIQCSGDTAGAAYSSCACVCMHSYVCMYVCMYACVCVCMYVRACMRACTGCSCAMPHIIKLAHVKSSNVRTMHMHMHTYICVSALFLYIQICMRRRSDVLQGGCMPSVGISWKECMQQ